MDGNLRQKALAGVQGQCEIELTTLAGLGQAIDGALREPGLSASGREGLQGARREVAAMEHGVRAMAALAEIAATGRAPEVAGGSLQA
jgi:hypothetical protein